MIDVILAAFILLVCNPANPIQCRKMEIPNNKFDTFQSCEDVRQKGMIYWQQHMGEDPMETRCKDEDEAT